MSADYLDLLLGRATGSVPAAEPRIHSAMAPSPAPPVWGEVVEERIVPYPGSDSSPYRGATPSPQAAAEAYMPPVQRPDAPSHPERHREQQDPPAPAERKTTLFNSTYPHFERERAAPARASADLLPPVTNRVTRQAEEVPSPREHKVSEGPPPQTVNRPEQTQLTRVQQTERGPAPSPQQPMQMPIRSLLPPREFAPTLTPNAPAPQPVPESRAMPASAPAPVTIRIDRIEVHAAPPAKAAAAPLVAKPPAIRLDDYLSRRKGAAR